jgi:hypothetical protein
MAEAFVGVVVMIVAATSLTLAVELSESAFRSAGKYPLNAWELQMLKQAGWSNATDQRKLQADLSGLPSK